MRLHVRHIRWPAFLAVLLVAMSVPAAVMAQSGDDDPIPTDARDLLSQREWANLYCLEASWQASAAQQSIDDIQATLDALDTELAAIGATITQPDYAAMRSGLENGLVAVCEAETAREAAQAAANLASRVRLQVRIPFEDFSALLRQEIANARAEFEQQIRNNLENYYASQRVTHESRLQQEFDVQVASRLGALGREPTQSDRESAEVSARAYVRQLAEQIESDVEAQGRQLVEQQRTDAEQKLRAVSVRLNELATRMRERTTTALSATAQTVLNEALSTRRDAILAIVDARLQRLRSEVESAVRWMAPEAIAEAQTVVDSIGTDRERLRQSLAQAITANDRPAFNAALTRFETDWEDRRSELDRTRYAAASVCEARAVAIESLRTRVGNLRSLLPSDAATIEVRERLSAVRSAISDLEDAIETLRNACSGGTATGDQVQALLDNLGSRVSAANSQLDALRTAAQGGRR